jgi:hypothetical protein
MTDGDEPLSNFCMRFLQILLAGGRGLSELCHLPFVLGGPHLDVTLAAAPAFDAAVTAIACLGDAGAHIVWQIEPAMLDEACACRVVTARLTLPDRTRDLAFFVVRHEDARDGNSWRCLSLVEQDGAYVAAVSGGELPQPVTGRPFPHTQTDALTQIARTHLASYARAFVERDFSTMTASFGFPLIMVEKDEIDVMVDEPGEPARLTMLRDLFEDLGFIDRRLASLTVRAISEHCLLGLVRWHYIDASGAVRREVDNGYLLRRQGERWMIRGVLSPDRLMEPGSDRSQSPDRQARPDWAPLAHAARAVLDHQRDLFREVDISAYSKTYLFPTLLSWPAGSLMLRELADVRTAYIRFRETFDGGGVKDGRLAEVRVLDAGATFMIVKCDWDFLNAAGVRVGFGTATYLMRRRAEGWRVAMIVWDEDVPLNLDLPADRVH